MRIPNPYFKNIPIIGNLIMDYIIFEYDYPVLFICKSQNDTFYLCDCCDTYKEQRWLIAPISIEDIENLLNNKLMIREAFENAYGLCCVATWSTGDMYEKYKLLKAKEFEYEDLPDVNEYIDAEIDEHAEYIKRIRSASVYKAEYNLEKKIKILSENTVGSVEFDGLMYEYQKERVIQELSISERVNSTLDGNVTIRKSQNSNYLKPANEKCSISIYDVFAA